MRRHSPVLLPVLFSALLLHAQNPEQSDATLLKSTTRAVVVDVLVTGSGAEPIGKLTQKDFLVFEDGKQQRIDFFEEHSSAGKQSVADFPPLPPHVFTNQPAVAPDDAVSVLLLDNLDTEQSDQVQARKNVAAFLANLEPGMRVAIYTLNARLQLLQGFTANRDGLRAAIESKAAIPQKNLNMPSRNDMLEDKEALSMAGDAQSRTAEERSLREYAGMQQSQQATLTLTALQQLARALTAIPGRKNLVWFASTFPLSLFPEGDNRSALVAFHGHELPGALRDTVNLLTTARVALYPVSARGIMEDRTMNADSGGQPNGDDFEQHPFKESAAIRANTAIMNQLATDTGGRAIYTTNDVGAALSKDVQNSAQYYTLAYTPTNTKTDAAFRSIEVKLATGKYKLAYRRGYFADAGPATAAKVPSDPLAPLLTPGLPNATQIVYRIRVTPQPPPAAEAPRAGGNAKLTGQVTRYKVEFMIPTDRLSFTTSQTGTHDAKIRLAIVGYGPDGKPANWTGGAMNLSLDDASFSKAQRTGIVAPMEIDLPKADLSLSTGIWDTSSLHAGTLQVEVNPDADATATSSH